MEYSKEEILNEYRKLRKAKGKSFSSRTFYQETPVSKHAAEVAFGSNTFVKIQRAAGDTPNKFGIPGRSLDEFFETYGQVVRDKFELKKLPTEPDWKHLKIKPT